MGTKIHTFLLTLVYIGLAICVTALVATAQIENFPHEVFGIIFFTLVVCHITLNRFWLRTAFWGKWTTKRVFMTAFVIVLALLSVIQIVNCILLSSYFWNMLPAAFAYFSASFHMCIGTWLFCLSAIHFGINSNVLFKNRLHFKRPRDGKLVWTPRTIALGLLWLALLALAIYGVIKFFALQMPAYLFMLQPSDLAQNPLPVRCAQYACVGVAIAGIAHWIHLGAQWCSKAYRHHRNVQGA